MTESTSPRLCHARYGHDQAARAWQDHRQHCPVCDKAIRQHRPGGLCPAGAELRAAWQTARKMLLAERQRSRQLLAGQVPLFDLPATAAAS